MRNDGFNVAIQRLYGQFIHRTQLVTRYPLGTRRDAERQSGSTRGYHKVPGIYIYENRQKLSHGARKFAGRYPGGPLMRSPESLTGCLWATGLM